MAGRILKSIYREALILFLFVFLVHHYFGYVDKVIKSDGTGYYEYLPSLFIHHDLVRKDVPVQADTAGLYQRINSIQSYVGFGDFKVNKYACGTALLQLPFFAAASVLTDREGNDHDGYQAPFQKAVFIATLFYLFLGIVFLRKLLELYRVNEHLITFMQLLLVLGTGVTNYTTYDACFSHIYSLFAITAFLYFTKHYFDSRNLNQFIFACLFAGLVVILRQVNVLIVLFAPFLAGSWQNLRQGVILPFKKPGKLFSGILAFTGMVFIQCLLWYLQTGKFFVYSYQGESFDFTKPHIAEILFSFQKGLFIYAPVLIFSLLGLIWLLFKKKYLMVTTWALFFLLITYILSSWHSWYYGASFGLRAYIDFYPVFFIPFALMLNGVKPWMKVLIAAVALLPVPLNIIQTYQYKNYILHWTFMDRAKYRRVFLKTDDRFKGLLWKKEFNYDQFRINKEVLIGNIITSAKEDSIIYSEYTSTIPDFRNVSLVQVLIDNDFNDRSDTKIILSISDSSYTKNLYWLDKFLVGFYEKELNEWHTGMYPFEIKPFTDNEIKYITLTVRPDSRINKLNNVRIRYLSMK